MTVNFDIRNWRLIETLLSEHTDTHDKPTALSGPLNWSAIITTIIITSLQVEVQSIVMSIVCLFVCLNYHKPKLRERKTVPDDQRSNTKTSFAEFRCSSQHGQISTFRRTETGSASEIRRRYADVLEVCSTSDTVINARNAILNCIR